MERCERERRTRDEVIVAPNGNWAQEIARVRQPKRSACEAMSAAKGDGGSERRRQQARSRPRIGSPKREPTGQRADRRSPGNIAWARRQTRPAKGRSRSDARPRMRSIRSGPEPAEGRGSVYIPPTDEGPTSMRAGTHHDNRPARHGQATVVATPGRGPSRREAIKRSSMQRRGRGQTAAAHQRTKAGTIGGVDEARSERTRKRRLVSGQPASSQPEQGIATPQGPRRGFPCTEDCVAAVSRKASWKKSLPDFFSQMAASERRGRSLDLSRFARSFCPTIRPNRSRLPRFETTDRGQAVSAWPSAVANRPRRLRR